MGLYYLNLYGTMCSEDGIDCIAVNGGGYFYNTADGVKAKMDVRDGNKLYRIELNPETLGGFIGVYDKDENFEAAGSIDLQTVY